DHVADEAALTRDQRSILESAMRLSFHHVALSFQWPNRAILVKTCLFSPTQSRRGGRRRHSNWCLTSSRSRPTRLWQLLSMSKRRLVLPLREHQDDRGLF